MAMMPVGCVAHGGQPLFDAGAGSHSHQSRELYPERVTMPSPEPYTLLIVDDSVRMRATVRSLLSPSGAQVVGECGTGAEAVTMYADLRPDWVLMDIAMPGMDGITATQRIRAEHPTAKVIIVTDFGDAALQSAAAEAGAVAYVRKDNLMSILEIIGE